MTKFESNKLEKVLEEAIRVVKRAESEFSESDRLSKVGNEIQAEIEKRKADNHMGYAEGINHVLAAIGFKHDKMKELEKLL